MKEKITTVLVIWVASFIGLILTAESLDYTFFLFFTAFAACSLALGNSPFNKASHEQK